MVKLTSSKGCRRVIEVEIPANQVENKYEEIYNEIKKIAVMPGFRKGKAPKDIVEKKYQDKATEEVLKDLVSTSYEDAIKQLKIAPVEYPNIKDVNIERNKPLKYIAEVDVRPDIKIKKYKGLKITKNKAEVKDEDVEKSVLNLREMHAKFTSADERSIADGDYIVCDLICLHGEKEVFKKESLWLLANEKGTVKELHAGILGMKKDEAKDIKAKLPKEYPDKELAEKEVVYKIKIKHIKEKKMPPLDDEFAKDLGKPTVAEFKDAIRKDLEKRAELSVNDDMRNQIMTQLLSGASFDVPESMAERQLKTLVSDAQERMLSQGVPEKDIEKNMQVVQDKLKPRARDQVKVFFLLDEVATLEHIKVEPKEVERAVEILAAQLKKDKKELLKEYQDKNLLQNIVGQIREEKTIDFLFDKAEVTEK